jgi:hypothetical protein
MPREGGFGRGEKGTDLDAMVAAFEVRLIRNLEMCSVGGSFGHGIPPGFVKGVFDTVATSNFFFRTRLLS